jgi:hypothetical protein
VDELPRSLPPIRSVSHHIDLIPGANFPNKAMYRLTPQDNEEVKRQVQDLVDKGLVMESLSSCVLFQQYSVQRKTEAGGCVLTQGRLTR